MPQGSHLGPLLFLLYAHDITTLLADTEHSLYADDLKLLRVIRDESGSQHLQHKLALISSWGVRTGLRLNASKSQVITFIRGRTDRQFNYSISGSAIARVSEVKDLGVTLDRKLDFRRHIDRLIAKCRSTLALVNRFTKDFGDRDVARTLYCSLVRPSLEYAAPIWSPHHAVHIARIESIQKQFVL